MATAALDCPTVASTLNLIVLVASLDQKQGHLTFTEELEIVLTLECSTKVLKRNDFRVSKFGSVWGPFVS